MLEVPASEDLQDVEGRFPWFVVRMMTDTWLFGLLVPGNVVLVIEGIDAIREHGGSVWLDVQMATGRDRSDLQGAIPEGLTPMFSPTERTQASVRADTVIAAFELAYT